MTDKITEDAIEKLAIQLLEHQGCSYIYGPTIAPDELKSALPSIEQIEAELGGDS